MGNQSGKPERVALLLVSHSAAVATGAAELAAQVADPEATVSAVGGGPDGSLGVDVPRVEAAMTRLAAAGSVVVLMDLGSSVLAVRAALGQLPVSHAARVWLADAPLVEGAVAAAMAAAIGADADGVRRAAEEARAVDKL